MLDFGQDKFCYTDNPNALLLRSMSVNPIYQGYAKQALDKALLTAFCKAYVPKCDEIVLGVNHANVTAQKVYEKVGFKKCQRTYLGQAGVQFVYSLAL
ncbi:GNAT family N-acetyltransferase [Moraxella nasovis]|nr:GNAT family N-acetyltransferase [Moraxella nasovis]